MFKKFKSIRKPVTYYPNSVYLEKGIEWLHNAQFKAGDGGIPAYFHTRYGYSASYPETTGYLIKTLCNLQPLKNELTDCICDVDDMKRLMEAYLIANQNDDGGWGHPGDMKQSMVFDSAQIIEGLSLIKTDAAEQAVSKAANFLHNSLKNGSEIFEPLFGNKFYGYQARTIAIAAEVAKKIDSNTLHQFSHSSYAVLRRRLIKGNEFYPIGNLVSESKPITHFWAYCIEGMYRASLIFDDLEMQNILIEKLLTVNFQFKKLGSTGLYIGPYDQVGGRPVMITGMAQIALINWMVYSQTGEETYAATALKMGELCKNTVDLQNANLGIRGGVPSCVPFTRKYYKNCYLNWALKFFLDMVIQEVEWKQRHD
jgi:hypothetical protein